MQTNPFSRQKRGGKREKRERAKKGRVDAGPAVGRHPLPEHAAWVMAFTQNSQMPWQLIRLLNASCINSAHTEEQQKHAPQNQLPTFSLPSREEDVLIEHFGWLLTLILDVSGGTRGVKVNEGITHRIPAGEGLRLVFHPAGAANCF